MNSKIFCESCNKSLSKNYFNRHLKTQKHKRNVKIKNVKGVEYLRNIIGDDMGDVVVDYIFQLERESRIEGHKKTFWRCLNDIIGKRMNIIKDDFHMNINYSVGFNTIEVEFIRETDEDEEEIFEEMTLNNMNNWSGFNGRELVEDILIGYSKYLIYDNKEEFINECMEEEVCEDEEEYDNLNEKYGLWYEDLEKKEEFVIEVLGGLGLNHLDREVFRSWLIENM